MATSSGTAGLDRGTVAALVAMALGVFLVANDFTALSVVVPEIENDLDTTLNRAQWVINAYTVVFGVLIVTGGRLADLFGRKRIFLIGAAIFATFSLLGGFANSIELLIAARALMAIGGAMVWPAVLGMTYSILPEEKAGLAGALIIGVAGFGNAIGPLTAGFLTDTLGWRWVFIVNVPVTLAAMIVTHRSVEEEAPGGEPKIDNRGIATLSASVIIILVALDQGTTVGFGDAGIVAMFVVGVALFGVFTLVERREGESALVPRTVIANRQFAAVCATVALLAAVYFAILVFVPQFAEKELGWSAFEAGLGLLPLMAVFVGMSFVSGALYNRIGARLSVGTGAACLTAGVLWLAFTIGSGYGILVPGLVVAGAGVGLFFSSVTTAGVTALDPSRASLAGGIVYMVNVAGGSLGIGLNTAIVLAAGPATGGIDVDGIRNAFVVDAALGVAGTVVALTLLRGDPTKPHTPHIHRHHRAHG